MTKKYKIERCYDCPELIDMFPSNGCYCMLSNKKIDDIDILDTTCPLEEYI